MKYCRTVELAVPADRAWDALSDLHRWPEWTSTVERVDTEPGPVHEGQTVAIKQPGRKLARYTVDVVEKGSRFRWGSSRSGIRQVADHVITATGPGSCSVALTFVMNGPLGAPLGALGAAKIRDMVDTEATSLVSWLTGTDPA